MHAEQQWCIEAGISALALTVVSQCNKQKIPFSKHFSTLQWALLWYSTPNQFQSDVMTIFHAPDGDSLLFNNSANALWIAARLECCTPGWKNVIPLCRGLDILGFILLILYKWMCHLSRSRASLSWTAVFETLRLLTLEHKSYWSVLKTWTVAWSWKRAAGFEVELPGFSVPIKMSAG